MPRAHLHLYIQGRIPGTDRWKPINENPEAEEDVPGALIVRIRENLDFGDCSFSLLSIMLPLTLLLYPSKHRPTERATQETRIVRR